MFDGVPLASLTVVALPDLGLQPEVAQTVSLIDVLWLDPVTGRVAE